MALRPAEKRQLLKENAAELQRRDEEEGSDDAAEDATEIRELQRRHSFNWMIQVGGKSAGTSRRRAERAQSGFVFISLLLSHALPEENDKLLLVWQPRCGK